MKNKIIKLFSLLLCTVLLVTMIPVQAADSSMDIPAEDTVEEPDISDEPVPDNPDSVVPDEPGMDDPAPEDPSVDEPVIDEPEVPINLEGSMYKKKRAVLTWNSEDSEAIYEVYRSTSEDSDFELIKTLKDQSGTSTFHDSILTLGETYYYKVQMIKDDTVINVSNTVSVKIRLKPVTNFKTTITSGNKVKLTWDKVSYATSYIIYRSTSKNGEYKKIANPKKTEYTDTNVYSARKYYYKIVSWKKDLASAKSVASKIVPAYTKANKPTITSIKYTSKKVTISWKKVTRADKYYIYRSTKNETGTFKKIGETKNLKYVDKTASAKKRYFYKVRSVSVKDNKNILGYLSEPDNIYTASIDPNKKMVALTFDDGPGPYTKAIVDCLKENNARATFFVLGERIDTYDDELAYTFKHGNEIANHSYSHPTLTSLSSSKIKSEISKTDKKVKSITGASTEILRTPGGATNSTVKSVCGKPIIFWSIDTLDWKHRNASQTISHVMNNVKDGDIILMHDIHSPTRDAALQLIPKLKKAGYQLVTVSELAEYKGYTMENGTVYSSFR